MVILVTMTNELTTLISPLKDGEAPGKSEPNLPCDLLY
jgi:hypothetical protein